MKFSLIFFLLFLCIGAVVASEFGAGWLAVQLNRSLIASDLALIVLINSYDDTDLAIQPFNLKYNFATWFDDVSVVSTARMDPRAYGGNWNRDLLYSRFKKMVKKHIGYGFYNYRPSTDMNSVMYSPIMGLDGLDQIGSDYLQ